jgi:hypothetical protein
MLRRDRLLFLVCQFEESSSNGRLVAHDDALTDSLNIVFLALDGRVE